MTSHTPSPPTSPVPPVFSTKAFVADAERVAREVRARCVAVGGDEDSEKDIVNAARALAGDLKLARAERALTGWEENLIEAVDAAGRRPPRVATIIVLAIAVLLVVATVVRVAL